MIRRFEGAGPPDKDLGASPLNSLNLDIVPTSKQALSAKCIVPMQNNDAPDTVLALSMFSQIQSLRKINNVAAYVRRSVRTEFFPAKIMNHVVKDFPSGLVRSSVPIEFPRRFISVNPRTCTYEFPRKCISVYPRNCTNEFPRKCISVNPRKLFYLEEP